MTILISKEEENNKWNLGFVLMEIRRRRRRVFW